MERADQYKLSEYDTLHNPDENPKVHLVRNRITGRICVKKIISCDALPVYRQIKALSPDGVPQIYELISDGADLIVLEEYISGRTLEDLVRESPFSETEALCLIAQLCRILGVLHAADPPVICRDLKAENVMLDENGNVKIVDFDIARNYEAGRSRDTKLLGTREYAAPEQYGYGQSDARTDIYALGVLLNYLILGKFPAEEIVQGSAGAIVRRCTRMDPDQRYRSTREMEEDLLYAGAVRQTPLSSAQKAETCGAAPPGSRPTADGRVKRNGADADRRQMLPPGFRTGNVLHMIAAVCGYILITWFWFTLQIRDGTGELLTGIQLFINRFFFWMSQILMIFLIFDYRGIRDRLPLVRSSRRIVRVTGYFTAWWILFVLAAAVVVLLETLFF